VELTGRRATTTRGLAWQSFGFLGGMTFYAAWHLIVTALAPLACEIESTWPLTAATVVIAPIIAASTWISWRMWRDGWRVAGEGGALADQRTAFLGLAGFIMNGLALGILLYGELHVWFLDPCLPPRL
jgi:hypothetical protein